MSRGVLCLVALALLCVAFAVLLWQRGVRAQQRINTQRFVERRVASTDGVSARAWAAAVRAAPDFAAMAMPGSSRPGGSTASTAKPARGEPIAHERLHRLPSAIESVLVRAGLAEARTPSMIALAVLMLGAVWIGLRMGVAAAFAASIAAAAVAGLLVTARAQRRRLAIVVQLPTFLDGIVRLVTLGNSVPAAFQAALQNTEAPLRECLDHVSRMMRAGVEIDRALAHVAAIYRTREFEFVGSVLRLSVKYGGRADVMLERMSAFMRDLEQAERELSAMSAETRLSAWVLITLPLGIGGFLIATNPAYFGAMWSDADGRRLVYFAFALQAVGGYLLYRMTRLRA